MERQILGKKCVDNMSVRSRIIICVRRHLFPVATSDVQLLHNNAWPVWENLGRAKSAAPIYCVRFPFSYPVQLLSELFENVTKSGRKKLRLASRDSEYFRPCNPLTHPPTSGREECFAQPVAEIGARPAASLSVEVRISVIFFYDNLSARALLPGSAVSFMLPIGR